MGEGECLVSSNSGYKACLQKDGNFAVMKKNIGSLHPKWKKIPGSAVNVDVDTAGHGFINNKNGAMYKFNGSKWNKINGKASDVAICADGTMWHIGAGKEAGGFGIYRM